MNVTKSIDNSSNVTFSATNIHKIMMLKLIINWAKLKCVCMLCRLQYIPKSTLLNNNRKVFSKSEYASIEFRYHSSQTKILIFNFLCIYTQGRIIHCMHISFGDMVYNMLGCWIIVFLWFRLSYVHMPYKFW